MSTVNCPYKYVPYDEETQQRLKADFCGYTDGLVYSVPDGWCMSPSFGEVADIFYNFKLREDDVFVLTFPRSGTTWTQEMTWCILNDMDLEKAKTVPLFARSPFIEASYLGSKSFGEKFADVFKQFVGDSMPQLETAETIKSPRLLKSHLALPQLNPALLDTCKVIYVARNPKDVIVSFYHLHRMFLMHDFIKDFPTFVDYFLKDQILSAPYWRHVLTAWERRDHPNLLFIFFEEMKKDLSSVVDRVCKFVNKPLSSEKKKELLQHLHFNSMKKNKITNFSFGMEPLFKKEEGEFVNKGRTGGWKSYFTPQLNEKVDKWIKENLKNSTLSFTMEL